MADRGKAAITDASGATLFGPQTDNNDACVIQNRGPNRAFGTADGTDAVDDTGFTLDPGESICTRDLTAEWLNGNFKFICAAGLTTTLYWSIK